MLNKFIFTSFLLILTVSCSGHKKSPPNEAAKPVRRNSVNESVEIKPEKTISDKVILRDTYNREMYPLRKIAGKKPVFIEVSASWCDACKEMEKTTEKLLTYFSGKVFFVRLYMAGDSPESMHGSITSMEIVSSPETLGIETTQTLPRIVILGKNGGTIIADVTGTYPLLYFYGILSEL